MRAKTVHGKKAFPDLFFEEKSVTKRLSTLLEPENHHLSLDQLKEKAIEIVNSKDTHVSDRKKQEYLLNFERQNSVRQFQQYITNIVLMGSNLSMNQ